ncbi:MAG: hypothetical protein ABW217_17755 [Polyangiaceae bacterium]
MTTRLTRPLLRCSTSLRARAGLCLIGAHLALACSSGKDTTLTLPPEGAEQPDAMDPPSTPDPSVYAMLSIVWSDDEPTGYVLLSDTLDAEQPSLDDALEVPGYASMAAVGGNLLVASGDEPSITRYTVGDDLTWQRGPTLSFLNQGLEEAGFFRQYLLEESTAYTELEVSKRVVWDPSALEIVGVRETSQLPLERDGLPLYANFNRSYHQFEGRVLRPFSYHDDDWYVWAADTQIVAYDPSTQEEATILDAPCPALDTVSVDEAGNSYFSTWEYAGLRALMGQPAPCVVRVTPEGELDSSWETDLTAWTGGRQIKLFRYVADGKAVALVLHDEDFDDVDFEALDPDGFYELEGQNYRFWLFDLEQQTAAPLAGIAAEDVSSTYSLARLDQRTFLFTAAADSSYTTVYELDASGNVSERFEAPGLVYQWLKLR